MSEDKANLELKKMRQKGLVYGAGLFALGFVLLFGIIVVFNPPKSYAPFVFVLSIGTSIVGIIYFYYVGDTAKHLLRSVKLIKQVDPDEMVITKRFVLGRKGKIYLLTKRTVYMLILLKFDDLIETNKKKIKVKLPRTKFAKSKKIAGKKVYYSRERCTIPISKDKYATGDAVVYSMDMVSLIPLLSGPPISNVYKFEKGDLFEIMNALENEVV